VIDFGNPAGKLQFSRPCMTIAVAGIFRVAILVAMIERDVGSTHMREVVGVMGIRWDPCSIGATDDSGSHCVFAQDLLSIDCHKLSSIPIVFDGNRVAGSSGMV